MSRVYTLILSLFFASSLVACSSGGGGAGSANDALVAGTSPELAKDILSRYGYSVEEFWQIVDKLREGGNLFFLPINSEINNLVYNCAAVHTDTDSYEKIELVNCSGGTCKIEFLYERIIAGTGAQQTLTARFHMKLKDSSDSQFYQFQSLDCDGFASGSQSNSGASVTYSNRCHAVDNFYGEFNATAEGRVDVAGENISITTKTLIVTPGQPEKYMQGGAAQVLYNWNSTSGTTFFQFNGQTTQALESPGWMPGLRVN